MIVKSTMLLLLIIAGVSLAGHGLVSLLTEFFWGNLLEAISVFMLMVFFPMLYLWSMIVNYRFWKHKELDQVIGELKNKLKAQPDGSDSIEIVKKGKDFFVTFVNGLHTKFLFTYFRKDKIEVTDIEWVISKAKDKGTENILIFCTGTLSQGAKELTKNSRYSFVIEDYRNIGDFNLKRYYTAPMKVNKKIA